MMEGRALATVLIPSHSIYYLRTLSLPPFLLIDVNQT